MAPPTSVPSDPSLTSRSVAYETDPALDLNPHAALDDCDRAEILEGLRGNGPQGPRSLSAKYFYDAEGSRLFEEICDLPEYYPTRTEIAILEARAYEIAQRIGPGAGLIEYGSGSSRKTRILLDALREAGAEPAYYMPLDISPSALREAARDLSAEYPALRVRPVCANYMTMETLPAAEEYSEEASHLRAEQKRLLFFPGSTIGNLHPDDARVLLRSMRRIAVGGGSGTESVGAPGALLIGVDLRKDPAVLERAYNDVRGVTAAFNLNILRRLNREMDADFPLEDFRHRAFFDDEKSRIEMHLVARRKLAVRIAGETLAFEAGESIHTENSYKYSSASFQALLQSAGFSSTAFWTDARGWFGVFYCEAGAEPT